MIIENLTNPGQPLANGDRVRVTHDNGTVEEYNYTAPTAPIDITPTSCSPIEFLLRFTSTERVMIKASSDPVIIDWLDILNHPALKEVHFATARPAVEYMVSVNLLTQERADVICPV